MSRNFPLATLLALLCAFAAVPAQAGPALVQRAFVSGNGNNANTAVSCAVLTPCKTFAAAVTVVAPNGEVVALDTAPYGSVTLTQSISLIAAPGVYAGISVFAGAGITIATPGISVVLRGITINGQGGANGINMTAGAKLTVENCVIANLAGSGILVNTAGTAVIVRVTDTTIRDNGNVGIELLDGARATLTRTMISGNQIAGVFVDGTLAGSITTADIADSTMNGNNVGVGAQSEHATAAVKISVRDSRIVGNQVGTIAISIGASVTLSVSNNMISNNIFEGISASGTGVKVWATGNTISDNGTAFSATSGGLIESAGNNAVRNNPGTDSAVATILTK